MKKPQEDEAEINVHIGHRLRMRREYLKFSQEKVGDHIGVSFQQIQKFEKGANRIAADQLLRVSRLLQVDPNYFYEGLVDRDSGRTGFAERQSVLSVDETLEGVELNRAFITIRSKKLRRTIVELVVALAEKSKA
ncbi:MAG: helix-turn-helix transcriptional regulator [Beijerinckiaceae bacterium]